MASPAVVKQSGKNLWGGGVSPLKASYGKLMMWFFLLSDAFTFSGLLITYGLLRYSHPAYQGKSADFVASHDYWPIPEKIFDGMCSLPNVKYLGEYKSPGDLPCLYNSIKAHKK